MLLRVDSMYEWFGIDELSRTQLEGLAEETGRASGGMVHVQDYHALAAIVSHFRPRRIFEIGTFLGVTSDFFLRLVPECEVVSIAYVMGRSPSTFEKRALNLFMRFAEFTRLPVRMFNNSDLSHERVGSKIATERKHRFRQLIGDSHELEAEQLLHEHGAFDLVFIDGDHSSTGVMLDTELAAKILAPRGVICWHDANPVRKYLSVQTYLEQRMAYSAVATSETYEGGIACWSVEIEERIQRKTAAPEPGLDQIHVS